MNTINQLMIDSTQIKKVESIKNDVQSTLSFADMIFDAQQKMSKKDKQERIEAEKEDERNLEEIRKSQIVASNNLIASLVASGTIRIKNNFNKDPKDKE